MRYGMQSVSKVIFFAVNIAIVISCDQAGTMTPVTTASIPKSNSSANADPCVASEAKEPAAGGHGDHMGLSLSLEGTHSESEETETTKPAVVTYLKDIAPLLNKSCASCHFEGTDHGPDLSSYEKAKQLVDEIIASVRKKPSDSGFMPEGGKAFSTDQITLLVNWKSGGSQLGACAEK